MMNQLMYKSLSKDRQQKGVGLIEVLVTLLILSASLLAIASLQSRSLMYNHSAYIRSQANILAFDMLERIRVATSANLVDLNTAYSVTPATFDLSSAVVTSPRAAADIDQWRRNIATSFPSGTGGITCVNATRICTITIK